MKQEQTLFTDTHLGIDNSYIRIPNTKENSVNGCYIQQERKKYREEGFPKCLIIVIREHSG